MSTPTWDLNTARHHVSALEESGLSVRAYASQHDLSRRRLYYWRERLSAVEPTPTMVELVTPTPTPIATERAAYRLHCPSGHIIECPEMNASNGLKMLLDAISGAAPC